MQNLNLREWWDQVGTENALRVASKVETTPGYFKLLRYGVKRPSGELALAILDAAREITPACLPSLEQLVRGVPKAGTGGALVPAPPSAAYMAASNLMRELNAGTQEARR